ncbi:hypothetical protein BJ742DRAFT_365961 [Cladochytrium replicatum]|nr:hypothetical protein BJ742DRAFT_365961 [Cladochytrium replicatum]
MENCFVPVLLFLGTLFSFKRNDGATRPPDEPGAFPDGYASGSSRTSLDSPPLSVSAEEEEYFAVPPTPIVECAMAPSSPSANVSIASTLVDHSNSSQTGLDWQDFTCLLPITEADEYVVDVEDLVIEDVQDTDDEGNSSTPLLSISPIVDPVDSLQNVPARFLQPLEEYFHIEEPLQSEESSVQLLPISPNPTPNEEPSYQAPLVEMFNRVYESYRLLQNGDEESEDDDDEDSRDQEETDPDAMVQWDWQWDWDHSSRIGEEEEEEGDESDDYLQNDFPFARFPEVEPIEDGEECGDCVDGADDEDEEDEDADQEDFGEDESEEQQNGSDSAETLNETPRHTRIFRTENIMVIAVFRPSNTLLLVIDRLGLISNPGSLPGLEAIFGTPQLQGQPPASKEAVDCLPVVDVTGSEERCLICQENLYNPEDHDHNEDTDVEASPYDRSRCLQMPCNHVFHEDELKEWLRRSNSCPACRYELMTANPEYNETVRQRMEARSREIS